MKLFSNGTILTDKMELDNLIDDIVTYEKLIALYVSLSQNCAMRTEVANQVLDKLENIERKYGYDVAFKLAGRNWSYDLAIRIDVNH